SSPSRPAICWTGTLCRAPSCGTISRRQAPQSPAAARLNSNRRLGAEKEPSPVLDRPLDQYAAMLPLEACGELRTSPQGLSDAEARERLAQVGPNTISDLEQTSILRRLAAPFANWITAILLVAGLLAFVSGTPVIGWAIIIVALLNGLFTAWQEYLA